MTRWDDFTERADANEAAGLLGQAVSQEEIEVVEALFAAFAKRDDDAARVFHPQIEIRPAIVGGPERAVYRGVDGSRQFWADVDAAWTEFRTEPRDFRDFGGGEILVLGRAYARARGGIALDEAVGWIASVRKGRIVRFRSSSNRLEALEAARSRWVRETPRKRIGTPPDRQQG